MGTHRVVEVSDSEYAPDTLKCLGQSRRNRQVGLDQLGSLGGQRLGLVRVGVPSEASDKILVWVLEQQLCNRSACSGQQLSSWAWSRGLAAITLGPGRTKYQNSSCHAGRRGRENVKFIGFSAASGIWVKGAQPFSQRQSSWARYIACRLELLRSYEA